MHLRDRDMREDCSNRIFPGWTLHTGQLHENTPCRSRSSPVTSFARRRQGRLLWRTSTKIQMFSMLFSSTIKPSYVPAGTEPRRGTNRIGIRFRGLPYLDHNY